jgi:hypothetical protein
MERGQYPPPPDENANRDRRGNGNGDGGFGDHDPPILGLFRKLPEPDEDWPAKDCLKWLQTAANIFDIVYKGEGGIISRSVWPGGELVPVV